MESIQSYLVSIVAVCMITVLATVLVRNNHLQRIVRFIGGILILLVVASPLLKLNLEELAGELQQAEGGFSYDTDSIASRSHEMLTALIKQNTESYIEDKAASFGATVQAEVTVSDDEYPVPAFVTIIGTLTPEQTTELRNYLRDALGISEERQEWKLYG